jgi:hypothetical protein
MVEMGALIEHPGVGLGDLADWLRIDRVATNHNGSAHHETGQPPRPQLCRPVSHLRPFGRDHICREVERRPVAACSWRLQAHGHQSVSHHPALGLDLITDRHIGFSAVATHVGP